MKTQTAIFSLKPSIMTAVMNRRIHSRTNCGHKLLCLFILLIFSSLVQAGELDDVSIQIIGLDQAPKEALQEIPLPPPASVSITDMQGDVLFNRPMTTMDSLNADTNNMITAPVAGGGTTNDNPGGAAGVGNVGGP